MMGDETNGQSSGIETGPCYFCGQSFDRNEYLCHGCGEIICEDCADPEADPWGEHHPEDHPGEGDT